MIALLMGMVTYNNAQNLGAQVNVFLGSSGDHGQLSPGASYPFYQMNIVPHTYPQLHAGYEHLAKKVIGFTHNRLEGVGCKGSGGLIMVKPYLGPSYEGKYLHKVEEDAGPGYYTLNTAEGVAASFAVYEDYGIHDYKLPKGEKGILIDFKYALNDAVVDNHFTVRQHIIRGHIRAKTTCNVGVYTIYYAIDYGDATIRDTSEQRIDLALSPRADKHQLRVSFSAVSEEDALANLVQHADSSYAGIKKLAQRGWEDALSAIRIQGGGEERRKLFYSLLYRAMQSPYNISNAQGRFRGTDGQVYQAGSPRYHGWAIWDNYKTQLPLLALLHRERYQDIVYSIANLYRYGKHDFSGPTEPANSVRTEHAAVVLLDAQVKGFDVPVEEIKSGLIKDTATFDFSKPDKFLEATYDMWAMSRLLPEDEAHYLSEAMRYRAHWSKEFKDLGRRDVDRMSARQMYQGTIRQYRWNVPFDVLGLIELIGGKEEFTAQLDDFFDNHYFNRANEPDIQSPTLYYASAKPWRYQSLVHELALDTVIQYYFNDNSRGIDPFIDRIYKNQPKAFVRTMDDDAGAMSAWFVLSALGLQQPLIGEPVYYLSVPFFPEISINNGEYSFNVKVENFSDRNRYIKSVKINGRPYDKLWITHDQLRDDVQIVIESTDQLSTFGISTMYVSEVHRP